MEFNYLSEKGAIKRERRVNTRIEYARMPAGAIAELAKELLEIEATGDRERAEDWFQEVRQNAAGVAGAVRKATRSRSTSIHFSFPSEGALGPTPAPDEIDFAGMRE